MRGIAGFDAGLNVCTGTFAVLDRFQKIRRVLDF